MNADQKSESLFQVIPNGKLCFFDKAELEAWMKNVRTGGMDEECPRGIAGGTRPAGTEVHHQVGHGRHIRLHQPVLDRSGAQPVQPYRGGTLPLPSV